MAEKTKYWVGILYPENMVENWKDEIGDLLQLPYAYCVHDKDLDNDGDDRKTHVHLILTFPNTTTYKHAFDVYNKLSASGRVAINKIEMIINIRHMYNYLIHDTDDCRKKGKYLYDKAERITGNNFDIGSLEQMSAIEKDKMLIELANEIAQKNFTNFADFYLFVMSNYDEVYFQLVKGYSGFLERLTKGNYQREMKNRVRDDFC